VGSNSAANYLSGGQRRDLTRRKVPQYLAGGGLDLPDQQRNRRRPAQLTRHKEIGEPPGGQLGVGPAA
jgi:hypothetical protein